MKKARHGGYDGRKENTMDDMRTVYSSEFREDIAYYYSDLEYSDTVTGCGYDTGRAYNLTFLDGRLIEVEEA